MKIGVIGNGFVGKATSQLECQDITLLCYDLNPNLCYPLGTQLTDLLECQIIFVSVPTPMGKDGSCHLNILNSVVSQLNNLEFSGFIVVRSTVPVGTCDKLRVYFMPEFLTEKNFINDFINNKNWIFGLLGDVRDLEFQDTISELFDLAYVNDRINHNNYTFVTNKEGEMIKMFRNCFLATKVAFCNEIYRYCQETNVNYDNMVQVAASDDRIGLSHTAVPGPDGKFGFGGTCFPKDMNSLNYEMKRVGLTPYVVGGSIERNVNVDRQEKDWEDDKGRAVV